MVYRQNTLYRVLSYVCLALVVLLVIVSLSFDLLMRIVDLILVAFILIIACVYFYLSRTE
jgi:hypothetical protein